MSRRVLGMLCSFALVLLSLSAPPARATVPEPTTPVTANSTYFDGLGSPYGGCGLPQSELESQDFVALNVYHTPGDYNFYPRPVTDPSRIGSWNNGRNCGRWVQVRIGDFCTGVNDGAPGQPFCRNGSWIGDAYNDAALTMLVADSCGDANAWCRDDPYHLDLAKASLNRFVKNGAPVGDLYPDHFNNRRIQWSFVPAPDYRGDIQIGFLAGAQQWWPAISVSRLPNGIHGVEYFANGAWQQAQLNGDLGQSYIIGGTTTGGTQFQIRVRDASDVLINNGRVYQFSLPASCTPAVRPGVHEGRLHHRHGLAVALRLLLSLPVGLGERVAVRDAPAGRRVHRDLRRHRQLVGRLPGRRAVRNNGPNPIAGWSVSFTFPGSQQVSNAWNAVVTQTGQQVTARNASWNGTVAGGATTSGNPDILRRQPHDQRERVGWGRWWLSHLGTSRAPVNLSRTGSCLLDYLRGVRWRPSRYCP